jgi:hypothetical protein
MRRETPSTDLSGSEPACTKQSYFDRGCCDAELLRGVLLIHAINVAKVHDGLVPQRHVLQSFK